MGNCGSNSQKRSNRRKKEIGSERKSERKLKLITTIKLQTITIIGLNHRIIKEKGIIEGSKRKKWKRKKGMEEDGIKLPLSCHFHTHNHDVRISHSQSCSILGPNRKNFVAIDRDK